MAQPPHFNINGSIYFITTRLREMGVSFTESETKIVEETILEFASEKEIILYAYVIMPDHIHLLIKTVKYGISKTMQLIKGRQSLEKNKSGELLAERFF